tara:strand:+ start:612 stop:950 length:339 start_codon:yes stop_codon:yes gene_type:complete
MVSLTKILLEALNNFSVEFDLYVDKSSSHYEITNQIRALKGVTIVTIITPEGYSQQGDDDYIRLRVKFITSGEAEKTIQSILDGALAANDEDKIRIQGVKSLKIRKGTIKRL